MNNYEELNKTTRRERLRRKRRATRRAFLVFCCVVIAYGVYVGARFLKLDSIIPNAGTPVAAGKYQPNLAKYEKLTLEDSDINRGTLVLVNGQYPYSFSEELNLVSLFDKKSSNYKVRDKNVTVSTLITTPLNSMIDAFYKKYNIDSINIVSGHRTKEYQQTLYDNYVAKSGVDYAEKYSAQPGSSEHHTGLAIDFSILTNGVTLDYDGTGDYKWINDNAYKYGFIVRYQDEKRDITGIYNEPWHFRYVGVPHSYIIEKEGFCYEEYITYLKSFPFGADHLKVECGGKAYEIYYVKGTQVQVPTDREYTYSGNNVDGFIVTVEL